MKLKTLLKSLGPGLLWAGAAIGVSHLVQSTRAGALYGFGLLGTILFINLIKYPFFEYGPRFAASTGKNLLEGYKSLGKWGVMLYFILTLGTMFTIQGTVTLVTAGLVSSIFNIGIGVFEWAIIILIISAFIVTIGKYSSIDKLVKIIIVLLALSTIIAVVAAASKGFHPNLNLAKKFEWKFTDIALLIAFAGWMPSAIDISVWSSVWSVAKAKETGYRPSVKETLFDFNVGYIGTAVLSVCFLALGAFVMYGSGETFSNNGTEFATQLISLFTTNLGTYSYVLIATAALATMASTTITCMDAYPRVLNPSTKLLFPKTKLSDKTLNYLWISILIGGTILLLSFFADRMKTMVDLATTLSFITAPVLAFMNFKVIRSNLVPKEHHPKKWLVLLSYAGIIILSMTSMYYIVWKFIVN